MGFGTLAIYQKKIEQKYQRITLMVIIITFIFSILSLKYGILFKFAQLFLSILLSYRYLLKRPMYYPPLIIVIMISLVIAIILTTV